MGFSSWQLVPCLWYLSLQARTRYSDLQGGDPNVWMKLKLLTDFNNAVREERKANLHFVGR